MCLFLVKLGFNPGLQRKNTKHKTQNKFVTITNNRHSLSEVTAHATKAVGWKGTGWACRSDEAADPYTADALQKSSCTLCKNPHTSIF